MSRWPPLRRQLALLALLVAVTTAALAVVLGGGRTFLPSVSVLVAVGAVFFPAGVTAQVLAGQALVAALLLAPDGPGALTLVPLVAGVVATAELLAAVARMDTPMPCDVTGVGTRVTSASAIGAGAFGAVALAGGLPGPPGLLAVILASGACVFLAYRLVEGRG